MSIPMALVGGFHHLPALSTIYCLKTVRMVVLSDGIWFLVNLIAILPVIIRVAEHLVFWLIGFFFPLKGYEENLPVAIGLLKVGWLWNLFLQNLLKDLSWGQPLLRAPEALWTQSAERTRVTLWLQECPQGGSTSSLPCLFHLQPEP